MARDAGRTLPEGLRGSMAAQVCVSDCSCLKLAVEQVTPRSTYCCWVYTSWPHLIPWVPHVPQRFVHGAWAQLHVWHAGVWLKLPRSCGRPGAPHLTQWPVEFPKDAVLIKHLPLVPVLIVIVDLLAEVSGQFVEGHVLLYLLVLKGEEVDQCSTQRQVHPNATQPRDAHFT